MFFVPLTQVSFCMKLLLVTQTIDKEDSVLGFFHRWVEEFAIQCEKVTVICLKEGVHTLPKNVRVYSLGKESGKGRITYLFRFLKLIWVLRNEYNHVFVHMNQVYVLLGGLMWRGLQKRVGLWYAHGAVPFSLRVAVLLAHHVYTSTPEGMRVGASKRKVVGQGIDTAHFYCAPRTPSPNLRLGTVGRISSSKNILTLIEACALVRSTGKSLTFMIVGVPITQQDYAYAECIYASIRTHSLDDVVVWKGTVSQQDLPSCLYTTDIFIHDGATQSLDKALLEAVACGCVVVSSNPAYVEFAREYTPELLYAPGDVQALAHSIQQIATLSTDARSARMRPLRDLVAREHNLKGLIVKILKGY